MIRNGVEVPDTVDVPFTSGLDEEADELRIIAAKAMQEATGHAEQVKRKAPANTKYHEVEAANRRAEATQLCLMAVAHEIGLLRVAIQEATA